MTSIQPVDGSHGLDEISTRIVGCAYENAEAPEFGVRQVPMHIDLTYRRHQPLEIKACFRAPGRTGVSWQIGRDLVATGLTTSPTGVRSDDDQLLSDIRISTHPLRWHDWTLVTLRSPSGTADIGLPTYELIQFIDRTEDMVPIGAETALITEAELDLLFQGGEPTQ